MRTLYIPEKTWKAALLVVAVLAMWGLVWLAESYTTAPTVSSDPFYNGAEDGSMASFAINVDWGEEYIPAMLDLFDEKGVQCTFFLTGRWAENHPELCREMVRRGHELGNHAYSHKSPNSMTQEQNQKEIRRTQEAIHTATGVETTLYAPPSGEREDQVLAAAVAENHNIILWSVDTIDWQKPTPEVMAERVLTKAGQGSIILMHPTENTVKALPGIIDTLQGKGLKLGTVSAVCRLYEVQPQAQPDAGAGEPATPTDGKVQLQPVTKADQAQQGEGSQTAPTDGKVQLQPVTKADQAAQPDRGAAADPATEGEETQPDGEGAAQ